MVYFYLSYVFIFGSMFTALFVGIKHWALLINRKEKHILVILIATILIELIVNYMVWVMAKPMARLYDMLTIFTLIMLTYWFYSYLKNKWLVVISAVFTIAALIADFSALRNPIIELPFLTVCAAFIITISVFTLLSKLILSDSIIDFRRLRPFWIAIGFLVYEVTLMPTLLFLPSVGRLQWESNLVLSFVNIILYGCMAYAFSLKESHE